MGDVTHSVFQHEVLSVTDMPGCCWLQGYRECFAIHTDIGSIVGYIHLHQHVSKPGTLSGGSGSILNAIHVRVHECLVIVSVLLQR